MTGRRSGRRSVRLAVALWITLAIVVWHVIFERIIIEAGRSYIRAARAAAADGSYLRVGDWMAAATSHAVWVASSFSLALLVVGLMAIRVASRLEARSEIRVANSGS